MCVAEYTGANRINNSQIEWRLGIGESHIGKYPSCVRASQENDINIGSDCANNGLFTVGQLTQNDCSLREMSCYLTNMNRN